MKFFLKVFLGILVSFLLYAAYFISNFLDLFQDVQETNYKCQTLVTKEKLYGPEDMQKITNNVAIISQADRIQLEENPNGFHYNKFKLEGGLFTFNFQTKEVKQLKLLDFPRQKSFQPLGLYFDQNTRQLFTINKPFDNKGDTIEQFQVNYEDEKNIKIYHKHSMQLPKQFTGMFNDLIKLKHGTLVVSGSFHKALPLDGNMKETKAVYDEGAFHTLLNQKKTNLYKCSFDENCGQTRKNISCQIIPGTQSNLNNGINWDRRIKVLVANTFEKEVSVYEVNPKDGHSDPLLIKKGTVKVSGYADNIDHDIQSKKFYVSGTMNMKNMIDYMNESPENKRNIQQNQKNKQQLSFVDELIPKSKFFQFERKEIFKGKHPLGGLSVSLKFGNTLVQGSWWDKTIAQCEIL